MLEIYTIYGGEMWKYAFDAVVGLMGNRTWITLLRIAGVFAVVGVLASFIKTRNPMMFVQWLAIFMLITSVMLVPKRSVQIIDITDPAAVWKTDNVPVGLAAIASLTTSIGFKVAQLYDMMFARPDSVTYTKSGMLFGSQIVAETSDIRTQNPELAQMLPDYVENCVIGDILLNHKYTINELLNTTDPLGLITKDPSPLRGIYKTSSAGREFLTCVQAAAQIRTLIGTDTQTGSATFGWLTSKIYGSKLNGASLLATAMGQSYGYFYQGGLTAAQVMKNNITNSAIRQGVSGFAARSSDTANLLNLATESAATKQRLSWAAGNVMATRTLPFAQSLLMLILVCLFPLVIALAAANHSLFGLNTLKLYVCGFLYFQMWPVMFAILNYAATFWLQSKTGGTALVLSNTDQVALQHSDVASLAGYLSLSIPLLSFYLTKGAASMGSQVAGSVFSSMAFGSAGVASTTADGNWSFNNMSMDNLNQNKMDTNLLQRQGQQTWQASNGSTLTQTGSGQSVIDGSGAMSNLPVNMKLSQLASSGFQEQARISQANAQTALEGYNHSLTSGWSQLSQLASQTGSSDSLSKSTDNSQATNVTTGTSKMISAVESYAKANSISNVEAFNKLMDISNQGSSAAGVKATIGGGLNLGVAKVGAEGSLSGELRHTTGSSEGVQDSHSNTSDNRHDKNSQMVEDFRQGRDMVTSSRVTDSGNHTDNASTSNLQQFASTLNDAKSQYQQYTTSSTRSDELSRLASLAQNQSASLDTNYTQEFVNWSTAKYGDRTQDILTSAPTARVAAAEFVQERLAPEITGDYQQGRQDLRTGAAHQPFTLPADAPTLQQGTGGPVYTPAPGYGAGDDREQGRRTGQGNYPYTPAATPYTVAPGPSVQPGGGYTGSPSPQGQPVDGQRYPEPNPYPAGSGQEYGPGSRAPNPVNGGGYYLSETGGVNDRRQVAPGGVNPLAYPQDTHAPRAGDVPRAEANGANDRTAQPHRPGTVVDERQDYQGSRNGGNAPFNYGPDNPRRLTPEDYQQGTGGRPAENIPADHNGPYADTRVPGGQPDYSGSDPVGSRPFGADTASTDPRMPEGYRDVSGSLPAGTRTNTPDSRGRNQIMPEGRHDVAGAGSLPAGRQQNPYNPSPDMPGRDGLYEQDTRPGVNPFSHQDETTRRTGPGYVQASASEGNEARTTGQNIQPRPTSAGQHAPAIGADPYATVQQPMDIQGKRQSLTDVTATGDVPQRDVVQADNRDTPVRSGTSQQERAEDNSRLAGSPLPGRGSLPSVSGNTLPGRDIAADYSDNQTRMPMPQNTTFPSQTALAQKVADERSANERNISKSAGEIGKKESTVQASSDILKGEMENISNKNALERKEAEIKQMVPVIDSAEKRKLQEQLAELRKKTG
ncbi:conjugal transfer mating pair stabilization protein TraG [Metakosakonia massiliensis]|uniref:TraG N-terminal Proteobacteria domain-containing protein n=1 Tax=Phytobacter massiliensis TaxID=1485952 RepID=A0A6N3E562_9ENTR